MHLHIDVDECTYTLMHHLHIHVLQIDTDIDINIHVCTYTSYLYSYQETLGQAAEGHRSLRQGRSCTISARPISPRQTLPPGVGVCVGVCGYVGGCG